MKTTLYPALSEVVELHTVLLKRFGGAPGLRDPGLLESALMRPRTGYYATLPLQAAALLQSLAQNHPFIDGNKRVAFAATAIFLRMNGWRLVVTTDDGEDFVVNVLIGQRADLESIARWIETRIRPAST